MIRILIRAIARHLAERYPDRLMRLLAATEANIAAVLENLADRPDAIAIRSRLIQHAGDERYHSTLLFGQIGDRQMTVIAGKRLDRRMGWVGTETVIRGGRKRLSAFRFLFLGQEPTEMSWCNLFALIVLLESYSAEFYAAIAVLPGWGFTERILEDERKHAALWTSHPERLCYWRCRIAIAIALTVATGGLNLENQTLE